MPSQPCPLPLLIELEAMPSGPGQGTSLGRSVPAAQGSAGGRGPGSLAGPRAHSLREDHAGPTQQSPSESPRVTGQAQTSEAEDPGAKAFVCTASRQDHLVCTWDFLLVVLRSLRTHRAGDIKGCELSPSLAKHLTFLWLQTHVPNTRVYI